MTMLFREGAHGQALQRVWARYENFSYLQQDLEEDLIQRLACIKTPFKRVFIYGGRTGKLLSYVQTRYAPESLLTADLFPHAYAAQALQEEDAFGDSFDLILSCGTWQWANGLPKVMQNYARHLAPGGLLLSSFYGGETLSELRQSLMQAELESTGGAALRVMPMVTLETAYGLFKQLNLQDPVADRERLMVTFPTLAALLRDLKGMGERLYLQESLVPLSRALVQRAGLLYPRNDKQQLPVSVERLTLAGWR